MSDEIAREFLVEGNENLDTLDREPVQIEKDPQNRATLASVFRTILPPDVSETIECHHRPIGEHAGTEMTCVVHLADLLCRLRGMGYGYYEAREFDLAGEVPWEVLKEKHPDTAAGLDMPRFTIELDPYGVDVQPLVGSIFSNGNGAH
jgi:hypothetical protein